MLLFLLQLHLQHFVFLFYYTSGYVLVLRMLASNRFKRSNNQKDGFFSKGFLLHTQIQMKLKQFARHPAL